MRASSSAWCGVVVSVLASTGCAPFFSGEAGPASPEPQGSAEMYRSQARAAATEGMYGAATPDPLPSPTPELPSPAAPAREPTVIVLRAPACCPGPMVVTFACADGSVAQARLSPRDEADAPPPAPYKPFDGQHPPSLYHDR